MENFKDLVKNSIIKQSENIKNLTSVIDDNFIEIGDKIFNNKSNLIITGVGKSGIIGKKIVATLNSTGTKSTFIHSGEAMHGDMGAISNDDIVIFISKSGNTEELCKLQYWLKKKGNLTISISSNENSILHKSCDHQIYVNVNGEVCPNNLAPTTSTTSQLVIGDSLAVYLMYKRNFKEIDFYSYHPGGSLGKKIKKVKDIELINSTLNINDNFDKLIIEITSNKIGSALIESDGDIVGIITDGDIRRHLIEAKDLSDINIKDLVNYNPLTITEYDSIENCINKMEVDKVNSLVVIDSDGNKKGFINIMDIRNGI